MPICCCCGFENIHGVKTQDGFWCERCIEDPNLFSPCKRILPHWTTAIKTQTVHVKVQRYAYGKKTKATGGEENVYERHAYLTDKAKEQLAMSESLYKGQKQISQFF